MFLKHTSGHVILLRYLPWLFANYWIISEGPRLEWKAPFRLFSTDLCSLLATHYGWYMLRTWTVHFPLQRACFPVPRFYALPFSWIALPASRHVPPPPLVFLNESPTDAISSCLESPHALWAPRCTRTFCHALSYCRVSGEIVCWNVELGSDIRLARD